MEGQEVVNEAPAEQTVVTESTPVEESIAAGDGGQTTEISDEAPTDESVSTDKVSKTVPYERFKEVNDKLKDLEDKVAPLFNQPAQPQYQEPVAELDPESARAVDIRANAVIEQRETAKFNAKHAPEFAKDPLLQAAFMVEANNMMAKGQYVDREAALEQAKKSLDARVKPAQEAAKTEGIKEGQDIAKTKQQLGAVGETGKQPEPSDDALTPAEYAKKYNIPVSY